MKKFTDTLNNEGFKQINNSKVSDLKDLLAGLKENGWFINPDLNFKGISGRVTKADYVWYIQQLVKNS